MDLEAKLQNYMTTGGYKNTYRTSQDIKSATHHYRGLQLKFERFIFNDGSQKELICLNGTIPVPYRGANYNIPVTLWVLDTYPLHAPMCFVCPTSDMQIRVSRHVDCQGKVYLPYLHEWNEGNSDLLGLIQICIITFSEMPPVFAKQQQQPPSGYQQPQQQQGYPPPTYNNTTPYPPYPNQQQNSQSSISEEYIKASLVSAVEDKIKRLLQEDFSTKQCELESLRKIKEELVTSQNQAKANLSTIESETARLADTTNKLMAKKTELEQTKSTLEEGQDMKVDEVVQAVYPLYNQLLCAYAEDAAIDDAIYYLGEGLRKDAIDCDTFLKNSRNISRRQFFLRLTAIKCRQKAKLDV